jgi:hypothetical protein
LSHVAHPASKLQERVRRCSEELMRIRVPEQQSHSAMLDGGRSLPSFRTGAVVESKHCIASDFHVSRIPKRRNISVRYRKRLNLRGRP